MESLERKETTAGPEEPIKSEGVVPSPDTSERSNSAASPPPNCSICLGKLVNTSFTDSCLHQFCFTCLLQWSKIKTECPLCKQTFKSIIHNVRSEGDYDQYHVQYSSQVAATLDVTADINISGQWDVTLGVAVPVRPFMYRTTLGGHRRYGMYSHMNPEAVARLEQIPSVPHQVSIDERRRRTANPIDFRRNVYRQGLWASLLPDAFGRFRESSAEYYRLHPAELSRLIPWINRELQVLLNSNPPHIAYIMNVVVDCLTQYDIESAEFRNIVRPYFGIHTDHFAHELANFARTNFDLIGYDQTVTYLPNRGLSNQYVPRAISPTPSTSSSSSSDSDVRILTDSTVEAHRYDPRFEDLPGPSTVGQAFRIQLPYTAPHVLTISSTSSSSENECEIIGYVKPRHERTPEIVNLSTSSSDEGNATTQSVSNENTQTEALLPLKEENLPSTSSSGDNNSSRRTRRRTEDIIKAQMFEYLDSSSYESDREEVDSDYNPSSTKPRRHKSTSKKSSKKVTRKLRSRKRKKSTGAQRKCVKETRNLTPYSSYESDNESPQREASSCSRGTKRYMSRSSDESNTEKVTKKNKKSKKDKPSKRAKKRSTGSSSSSKAAVRRNHSSCSNSSDNNCNSDSEVRKNNSSRRRKKSSATTNSSRYTSSDERSANEKASSSSSRLSRRRTNSNPYSDDSDFSTYRKSASFSRSSTDNLDSRSNGKRDWHLRDYDSSRHYTSDEEEEEEGSNRRCSSTSTFDPSSSPEKKNSSSKSSTATSGPATSQTTSQSSEKCSSSAATTTTSASSSKSDSPTEHSASSKTSRERHRSHKKRKESKKRRRSRS